MYDTLLMDGQKCTYATEPPLGSQDVNGFKALKCRRRLDTPPYPLQSRQTLSKSAAGDRATRLAIIHGGLLRICSKQSPPTSSNPKVSGFDAVLVGEELQKRGRESHSHYMDSHVLHLLSPTPDDMTHTGHASVYRWRRGCGVALGE